MNLPNYVKESISVSESNAAQDKKYWAKIATLKFKGDEKENEINRAVKKLHVDEDFSDWFFDKAIELQDLCFDNDWDWGSDDGTEYTSWGVMAMGEDFYNKVLSNDPDAIQLTEDSKFQEFGEYCGYAFQDDEDEDW